MTEVMREMLQAGRGLRRRPLFGAVAILSVALGLGATTAVFSMIYSSLLAPLPFPDSDRIVRVWGTDPRLDDGEVSNPDFEYFDEQSSTFEVMAGVQRVRMVVVGDEGAERLRGEAITSDYFRALGLKPLLGRLPSEEQFAPGGSATLMISYRIWTTRYGSDPEIVGKVLSSTNTAYEVIGVLPPGFLGTTDQDIVDFWVPLEAWVAHESRSDTRISNRAFRQTRILGKLKPGSSIAEAQTELATLAGRLADAYPETNQGRGARVEGFAESWRQTIRPGLLLLLAGGAFILLIGCTNVANLLLNRMVDRRREIALRTALGARVGHLLRQLMLENLLLAILGGIAGTLLAVWMTRALIAISLSSLPNYVQIPGYVGFEFHWISLAFGMGLALLTSLLFGVAPALLSLRPNLVEDLKQSGRSSSESQSGSWFGSALVVTEVALATALLVGAGLLLRSFHQLDGTDLGYRVDNILKIQVTLGTPEYADPGRRLQFYDEVLRQVEQTPGVRQAAMLSPILPMFNPWVVDLNVEGAPPPLPGDELRADLHTVTPGFFDTLGIRMTEGRDFELSDDAESLPTAIVSRSLARRIAPDGSALGRRVSTPFFNEPDTRYTIVGVVDDVKYTGPVKLRGADLDIYLPLRQLSASTAGVVIWTTTDPEALGEPLYRKLAVLDPAVPVHWVETMQFALDRETGPTGGHFQGAGLFAVIAIMLAVIGIYGVLAYRVGRRANEIGIRMALGAQKGNIISLVLRHGMGLVVTGLALGLAGAYALTRAMASLLHGVEPTDPITLVVAGAGLFAVGLLACYVPARRAASVDPMEVLHAE